MNRREFLINSSLAGCGLAIAGWPESAFGKKAAKRLVILHTNDVHSRIDPFPANDPKFPNAGGFSRRAALIEKIRKEEENVLLFDAGDIFQGTPYFNLFQGELEIDLMTRMGYDAVTIGNHDFDGGIDNLAKRIRQAGFPFLSSNYDFASTPVSGLCEPMKIFEKNEIRTGVFGIGIELKGLVDESSHGGTRYMDPLVSAKKMSRLLRHDHRCDVVICLSHLGYKYENDKISDVLIARNTEGIDLIIGGHTHTFLDAPVPVTNQSGKVTLVTQAGWGGIRLGRVDFAIGGEYNEKSLSCSFEKNFNYTIA